VVGYPNGYSDIQASDFSSPDDWAGRRIHVLGGTPPTQWAAIQDLTDRGHHGTTLADFGVIEPEPKATIVGLDWNGLYRMATYREFWHYQEPHWRPADHCSIRGTVRATRGDGGAHGSSSTSSSTRTNRDPSRRGRPVRGLEFPAAVSTENPI